MTAQTPGRGVSGLETPLEEHPGPAQLDLDAIRERVDAATPGPWQHIDHGKDGSFMGCGQVVTWGEGVEGGDIAAPSGDYYPRSGYSPLEDMAFIAAARTDVPALLDEVQRLHTWSGLMSVVDEQYPTTVFPVQPDDNRDGDYGPRILSLLRHLDELRQPEWAQTLFDQRDAALEAVARVRKLHTVSRPDPRRKPHCTFCLGAWPCETIQALEGSNGL